jgi:hypothetical protein
LEIYSASFHSNTTASTLELLLDNEIKSEFLKTLDSVVQHVYARQLVYANNFHFAADRNELNGFSKSSLRKKELVSLNNSTLYLSFDISERPINIEIPVNNVDTNFVNELAKKKNICIYQFNIRLIHSDESVVLEKQLFVLLARSETSGFLGFEHPYYHLGTISINKLMQTCLPILLDSSNESELIQVSALPAYAPDNFIQTKIKNAGRTYTNINKNIVQYSTKNGIQSFRFQEPAYAPIILKGKNQTVLPAAIQTTIRSEKGSDYIYLWEESRDIFADQNYKLLTIASVGNDPYTQASPLWVNQKTGLPFQFLKGAFHCLIQDKDTIAHFSIHSQVSDTSKKVFYDQLLNPKDLTSFSVSKNNQAMSQVYHYVLAGSLKNNSFKILMSGINGTPSIKEIYYKNNLVCIAKGAKYPEIMSIIDTDLSPEILNQLLMISFSSLF